MEEKKRELVNETTLNAMLPFWLRNFAYNVPFILGIECPHCKKRFDSCKDVRDIKPVGGPAIIIGNSPALDRLNHLEILAKSGFRGTIIATDIALIKCLKAGVIPDYVCSVDGADMIAGFYRHGLVDKHTDTIKAVFNSMVHPSTLREFKGEKYIFHSTLDADSPTSLTRAMHYMTRNSVVPGTGEVGGFCTHLAIGMDCNPIAFIGLSYAGYALEELGDYVAYIKDVPKEAQTVDKYFWKHQDPWGNECWTSMLWESCWDTFKDRITFYSQKKKIRFINCTGMGLVHDVEGLECMSFEDFLRGCNEKENSAGKA